MKEIRKLKNEANIEPINRVAQHPDTIHQCTHTHTEGLHQNGGHETVVTFTAFLNPHRVTTYTHASGSFAGISFGHDSQFSSLHYVASTRSSQKLQLCLSFCQKAFLLPICLSSSCVENCADSFQSELTSGQT